MNSRTRRNTDRCSKRLALASAIACGVWLGVHAATPSFTDVTKAAGIGFVHNNGAAGKRYYA